MKIQSLSVVVPNSSCINNCAFCVSRMHANDYDNKLNVNSSHYDLYEKDFINRLAFARDNGCNTVMLTGCSEPQQNRQFLTMFGTANRSLDKPFRWIEMQTTGVLLDAAYLRFLRNHVGVNVISLSLSSLHSEENAEICRMPVGHKVRIQELCKLIKEYDFTLRLSLNMTCLIECAIETFGMRTFLRDVRHNFFADQVTFRALYSSPNNTPQDHWISENAAKPETIDFIKRYIKEFGRPLEKLEFGQTRYSLSEMSVVLDDDCMSQQEKEALKYLILRSNCKLYTKWDDRGSLLF